MSLVQLTFPYHVVRVDIMQCSYNANPNSSKAFSLANHPCELAIVLLPLAYIQHNVRKCAK